MQGTQNADCEGHLPYAATPTTLCIAASYPGCSFAEQPTEAAEHVGGGGRGVGGPPSPLHCHPQPEPLSSPPDLCNRPNMYNMRGIRGIFLEWHCQTGGG